MRRYVLTGAPGAGKTSILRCLGDLGFDVVQEAATEIIARAQARGEDEPWTKASFVDDVVALQRRRQAEAETCTAGVQVFDRSPVCTHALAEYLGLPISRALRAEVERITAQEIYERRVLFVRNLGFCEPTAARRISFRESLVFEGIHERSYRAFGYDLVEIPAGGLAHRVAAVCAAITPPAPAS